MTADAAPEGGAAATRPGPWPSLALVVGAGFAVWGLYIGLGSIGDNSFLTHLATGRLILDHGIPRTDPYSFTAPGHPWVVQSWLASVIYAASERLGGPDGVRVLTGVLSAGIAACAWRLTKAATLVPRVLLAGLVVAMGTSLWAPRPLLFGLLFLGATLLVVEEDLPPWLLVPVFWFWVNTHGSFPLGLVAVACLYVGGRLDGDPSRRELRALAWAAGGTVLGAVNPLGPTLLTFPVGMLGKQKVLENLIEWQSPNFSTLFARLFFVLVALCIVGLVRRPSWRAAVPLIVFVGASLAASRNIAVASLVVLPGAAVGLQGLGSITGEVRSRLTTVLLAAVVVVGLAVTGSQLARPTYDLSGYPVDALGYLSEHGEVGPGATTRIAAPDTVGNYMEGLFGADASVFIDDRLDMYPTQVVHDELVLYHGDPTWSEVLDRWGITTVVWPRQKSLTALLTQSPRWRLAYSDAGWVVFERV